MDRKERIYLYAKVGKRTFPDSYSYIIPADAAKVPFSSPRAKILV